MHRLKGDDDVGSHGESHFFTLAQHRCVPEPSEGYRDFSKQVKVWLANAASEPISNYRKMSVLANLNK